MHCSSDVSLKNPFAVTVLWPRGLGGYRQYISLDDTPRGYLQNATYRLVSQVQGQVGKIQDIFLPVGEVELGRYHTSGSSFGTGEGANIFAHLCTRIECPCCVAP